MTRQSSSLGPQGSSQLEQVLTILLQGGSLTAEEKRAWFRTSKGLAELVLRHTACTHLTHRLSEAAAAGSSRDSSSRTVTAHAAGAAQQLAALSRNVTLTLHGCWLTPAACLWQSITTMQLHNVRLDHSSISHLQLHRLPHLHTLSLMGCGMVYSSEEFAPARSTTVRSLTCLNCVNGFIGFLRSVAFELIDPSQLHSLISDELSNLAHYTQMPALQELHIVGDRLTINDESFQQLLAHPKLARVELPHICLVQNHADKPCTWDSLRFSRGVGLQSLARMPLAGIQSCIVHDHMSANDWPRTAAEAATGSEAAAGMVSSITGDRARCLVFQASSTGTGLYTWEPCFTVNCHGCHSRLLAQAITLAMRHLAPGVALMLHDVDFGSDEVLASLATAPATLTTLCLFESQPAVGGMAADGEAAGDDGAGVLANMPHVQHLLVGVKYHHRPEAWWLRYIRLLVAGVSRPLRLTFVLRGDLTSWLASDQHEILQWVATNASEKVKVEFQDYRTSRQRPA